MVEFGVLTPEGVITQRRTIPQEALKMCEHMILAPEHYREDNTCRCDDPTHTEMRDWGYVWTGVAWV